MRVYVLEHGPGCTFAVPCLTCQVENFLRLSLNEEQFGKYRVLLDAAAMEIPDPSTDPLDTQFSTLRNIGQKGVQKLANLGITTFRDLMKYSETELKEKGCSKYLIDKIKHQLANFDLILRTA